jgi:hypothetical protein
MQFTELWDSPSSMEIQSNFISCFNGYSKIGKEFRATNINALTAPDNAFLKYLLKPLPKLTTFTAAAYLSSNWPFQ